MAHNIDQSNGRDNIAFLGSRNDVWHRLGQEMQAGMSIDQWAEAAGLNWEAIKVPAMADLTGSQFNRGMVDSGLYFNARSDTGAIISGALSDRHINVQPRDVLAWFDRYISVDPRFTLDVAGSLNGGSMIWATATFNGEMTVAGEKHVARLLMSTTFDASGATVNQGTMTRVVCNNTLNVALADKRAMVRTRHSTAFKPETVAKELAAIAQGFEKYKAMGDALAQNEMTREETAKFFKQLLDIPFDAKGEDVSTRKMNQFRELSSAYSLSVAEGADRDTGWAALQAITRYVDHTRSTRGGTNGEDEARFASAQFGSGANMKAEAMGILMPRIKDRVPVLA